MKYKILYIVVALLVLIACGSGPIAEAGQAGIPLARQIPQHGHSGALDGGVINLPVLGRTISGNQTLTSGVETVIQFPFSIVDNKNWWVGSPSYYYQPKIPGNYFVCTSINAYCTTSLSGFTVVLYKTGGFNYKSFMNGSWGTNELSSSLCGIYTVDGSTDTLYVSVALTGTGTCRVDANSSLSIQQISR